MQFQNRHISAPHEIGTDLQDCLADCYVRKLPASAFHVAEYNLTHIGSGCSPSQVIQATVTVGRGTSLQCLHQGNVIANMARLFVICERFNHRFTL